MQKNIKKFKLNHNIIISIVLLLATFLCCYLYNIMSTLPVDIHSAPSQMFVVKKGQSIDDVANKLYNDNIIRNKEDFITQYENKNQSNVDNTMLVSGGYVVNPSWDLQKNVKSFLNPPNDDAFKECYFKEVAHDAQVAGNKYHVLPSIIMAHSAIESNFGMSELSSKYNNYFGIKTNSNKNGVTLPTQEVVNGDVVNQNALFLKCKSRKQCFEIYARTLANGNTWNKKQFADVVNQKDYKKAADGLVKDHYATDPNLNNKIIKLIQKFNLTKYDY